MVPYGMGDLNTGFCLPYNMGTLHYGHGYGSNWGFQCLGTNAVQEAKIFCLLEVQDSSTSTI